MDVAQPSWIASLVDLADGSEPDTFVAVQPESDRPRLFGGLIAAQGLMAACRTVDASKLPHSLHAYFVRPGKPDVDVEFTVERTRDGRAFDTRCVTARQHGKVMLEMLTSFQVPETGADFHPPEPLAFALSDAVALPGPEPLSAYFEIRVRPGGSQFSGTPYWIRTHKPVEDDPVIRACALTFMSDMGLMIEARPPGVEVARNRPIVAASLDHTVWFHRAFASEEWHQYQAHHLNSYGARGLARAGMYRHDGLLVASMAQEALWRTE